MNNILRSPKFMLVLLAIALPGGLLLLLFPKRMGLLLSRLQRKQQSLH